MISKKVARKLCALFYIFIHNLSFIIICFAPVLGGFYHITAYVPLSDSGLVGTTGLEPAASWSQTKHSTKLSYVPIYKAYTLYQSCRLMSMFFVADD